jgi:hypothetical protein
MVTDTAGAAIANATVSFVHETDGGLHVEARTDKDGLYQIQLTALTAILEGRRRPPPTTSNCCKIIRIRSIPRRPSATIFRRLPTSV